jgi:hypothetical protein
VGRAERLLSGTDGQKWPWDSHRPMSSHCLVLSGMEKKYDVPRPYAYGHIPLLVSSDHRDGAWGGFSIKSGWDQSRSQAANKYAEPELPAGCSWTTAAAWPMATVAPLIATLVPK